MPLLVITWIFGLTMLFSRTRLGSPLTSTRRPLAAILSPALVNEESPTVLKKILGKVLEYVAFTGSMEHATQYGPAHDEVRAAMESVFPVSMLSRFLTLPVEEKQTQMEASADAPALFICTPADADCEPSRQLVEAHPESFFNPSLPGDTPPPPPHTHTHTGACQHRPRHHPVQPRAGDRRSSAPQQQGPVLLPVGEDQP